MVPLADRSSTSLPTMASATEANVSSRTRVGARARSSTTLSQSPGVIGHLSGRRNQLTAPTPGAPTAAAPVRSPQLSHYCPAVLTAEQREQWDEDGFVILRRSARPAAGEGPARPGRGALSARGRRRAPCPRARSSLRRRTRGRARPTPRTSCPRSSCSTTGTPSSGRSAGIPGSWPPSPTCSGPDLDCFLSQFIFKNPGASGQPWHQDSFYFPFEPDRPASASGSRSPRRPLDNGPPVGPARLAPRAGPRARPRHAARVGQLRLRRDRRPRHGRRDLRAHGARRPAACSTATSCTARPTTAPTGCGRRWCTTTASPGRSTTPARSCRSRGDALGDIPEDAVERIETRQEPTATTSGPPSSVTAEPPSRSPAWSTGM